MRTAKPATLLLAPSGENLHFVRFMEEIKEKKHKGGRPKKEFVRKYKMGFNATEQERDVIKSKAELSGLKVADYLRDLALKGKIRRINTPEEIQFFRDLRGIANNLNQLVKEAHKQELPSLAPLVLRTLNEINKTLKNIDNKNQDR